MSCKEARRAFDAALLHYQQVQEAHVHGEASQADVDKALEGYWAAAAELERVQAEKRKAGGADSEEARASEADRELETV